MKPRAASPCIKQEGGASESQGKWPDLPEVPARRAGLPATPENR
jgi:hypothetical protein